MGERNWGPKCEGSKTDPNPVDVAKGYVAVVCPFCLRRINLGADGKLKKHVRKPGGKP